MKKEKLTKTQSETLNLGHHKGTFSAQDLPLNGGAAKKVIDSLLKRELICEVPRNGWMDYALTPAGRQAIGVEEAEEKQKPKTRSGTKLDQVIKMLSRPEGATIAQIMEQTGWQQHTVHGTLAGALKKRLGLTIESEKPDDGKRIYRITGGLETA